VVLLTVGHRFSFMCEVDLFVVVLLGAFALMLGPPLFGIAFLRKGVLPRYGRVLPLFTGLMGFVWLFFTGSETSRQLTFSFMFFRSLFALGWILLGYVLWSDGREIIETPRRRVSMKRRPEDPSHRLATGTGVVLTLNDVDCTDNYLGCTCCFHKVHASTRRRNTTIPLASSRLYAPNVGVEVFSEVRAGQRYFVSPFS
jgi:hypothetical protein